MRITWIRSSTWAVGMYRAQHPAAALQAMGHDVRLLTLTEQAQRVSNAELAADVLVLARQTHASVFDLVDTLPVRPVIVYEVDDNPWEWHPWDPIHCSLGHDYGQRVKAMMQRSDAFTCSTPTLAARIRREVPGKPLWVVPNAIDYQYRDWTAREDRAEHDLAGKTVLGWTGSIHHGQDGGPLLKALEVVLADYPEAVFLMQCDRSVYYTWTQALHARFRDQLRWVPPLPFEQHPAIYSLFDLNLAPLANTPFNACKSDLRLIEGGAHGVPYVASKIAPYQEFDRQSAGIGGVLASTAGEWVDGIEQMMEQQEARGQSLARYVKETRALSIVAGQWETALQGAITGKAGETVRETVRPTRNDPCPCGTGLKYKKCCVPAYG